jgi:anti-sigma factor RsiW
MSCPFRTSIGAYLLGALSPEETRQTAAHLRVCADCRAEVADLNEVVEILRRAAAFLRRFPLLGPSSSA